MITIHGKWFDGQRSVAVDSHLRVFSDGAWQLLRADESEILREQVVFSWQVSGRLGGTPRYLTLPDKGSFETLDNDGIDAVLSLLQRSHWSGCVYFLESRICYVLVAVLLFAIMAFAGVRYGIPSASKIFANHLPEVVLSKAGEQSLAVFDKTFLKPSELEQSREKQLRSHLQTVIDEHQDLQLEILFRKGGPVGPNAFALPGGQIIFTDEMVGLAEHDDELLAVLVHEIGHVVHRHGIRRLIQGSLLSFAVLAVTGDASGVAELFLGLPVVLTELGYSRGFEIQADMYALRYLRSHAIDPHHFANIMTRITAKEGEEKGGSKGGHWTSYLSTHPAIQERIKLFTESE